MKNLYKSSKNRKFGNDNDTPHTTHHTPHTTHHTPHTTHHTPQISIIIPCYNVEKYVAECLKSIVEQSYHNLEIIVVNDGSTDNTEREILPFLEDKRVKYIVQENQGLSGARNTGLDNISGEYVCFVDSDDFIHPDFVKILYQNLVKNNADVSICDFYRYCGDDENKIEETEEEISLLNRDQAMQSILQDIRMIVAWNKLYKASLFDNLRFALGRIHEDEFIVHHLFWKTQKICFSNRKLYFYRQTEGSIMNSKYTDKKLKDSIDAFDDRIQLYKNNKIRNYEKIVKLKWSFFIYQKGLLENNLDTAKFYILSHPLGFYRNIRMRKKDKIKLYLKLLKEKIQK